MNVLGRYRDDSELTAERPAAAPGHGSRPSPTSRIRARSARAPDDPPRPYCRAHAHLLGIETTELARRRRAAPRAARRLHAGVDARLVPGARVRAPRRGDRGRDGRPRDRRVKIARTRGASSTAARARDDSLPALRQRAHGTHQPRRRDPRLLERRRHLPRGRGGERRGRAGLADMPQGWSVATALERAPGQRPRDLRRRRRSTSCATRPSSAARSSRRSSTPRQTAPLASGPTPTRAALDWDRLVTDTRTIVETEARLIAGDRAPETAMPYEHYLFVWHVSPRGRGGLEHRASSTLLAKPSRSPTDPATSTCFRSSPTSSSTSGT